MKIKELINICIKKNIAFYSYRPSNQIINTGIQLSHKEGTIPLNNKFLNSQGFIIHPFKKDGEINRILDELTFQGEIVPAEIGNAINNASINNKEVLFKNIKGNTYEEYCNKIVIIKDNIKKENTQKCVLSNPTILKGEYKSKAANIYLQLTTENKDAYVSIFNLPDKGLWIGATPEKILSKHKDLFETVALAGTRKESNKEVPWDEKNKQEQKYVSNFLENLLSRDKISYKRYGPSTQKADFIEHLKTTYQFSTKTNALDLLNAIHPTPATCGYPQSSSYQIINNIEQYDRNFYCGYIGHIQSPDDFDFYVNLRCIEIQNKEAIVYSGGGITLQSEEDKEWEEIQEKANTIIRHLNDNNK